MIWDNLLLNSSSWVICIFLFLGDIESMPFIEALRQLSFSVGEAALFYYFKEVLLIAPWSVLFVGSCVLICLLVFAYADMLRHPLNEENFRFLVQYLINMCASLNSDFWPDILLKKWWHHWTCLSFIIMWLLLTEAWSHLTLNWVWMLTMCIFVSVPELSH